jgi:ABC-type uncharacterized transport system substrate-binding protein
MFEGARGWWRSTRSTRSESQDAMAPLRKALRAQGIPLFPISARTGEGVPELMEALWRRVDMVRRQDAQSAAKSE